MCFHMYVDVCAHACVYVHFCIITPQVLKLALLPPPILKSFLRISAKQQFLGRRLKHKIILISFLKVRKDAKISNAERWCAYKRAEHTYERKQPIHSSTTFDPGHPIGK